MNARSQQQGSPDAGKVDPRIHKAEVRPNERHCWICGQPVHTVMGGQGKTLVHSDSGAVVAHDPPLPVAELIAERDRLNASLAAAENANVYLNESLQATRDARAKELALLDTLRAQNAELVKALERIQSVGDDNPNGRNDAFAGTMYNLAADALAKVQP